MHIVLRKNLKKTMLKKNWRSSIICYSIFAMWNMLKRQKEAIIRLNLQQRYAKIPMKKSSKLNKSSNRIIFSYSSYLLLYELRQKKEKCMKMFENIKVPDQFHRRKIS